MTEENSSTLESVAKLVQTVHRLRAPNGCPWDRAQSHQSLRPYLIEEAYEVLDVLDRIHTEEDLKKDEVKLPFREELGDLLMQVVLHSELADEKGIFHFYDVANTLNEKLIRRHPHVFGESRVDTADKALQNWEKEKAKEKANRADASVLEGVPKSLPALQKATRVIEKVTKVGFQWTDLKGPIQKLEEEIAEFKQEIQASTDSDESRKKIESELGDVLFSICNIAHFLKVNPENSLRSTLTKFERRFRHVERSLKAIGKSPEQSNLEEMDRYWDEAKKMERVQVWGLTGGIGAGKSTASRYFSEAGIPVVDADQIAREIRTLNPVAKKAIQERFGTHETEKLREIVFNTPEAKKDLERILHPLIREESQKRIEELSKRHPVVLYEASLLIDAGRQNEFAGIIVIEAPHANRIERLKKRDRSDEKTLENIIQSQLTDEQRRQHAQIILENNGSEEELKKKIQTLIQNQGWKIELMA